MTPTIMALRSISSEFAFRLYWPVLIVMSIISIVVVGLMIWLITISLWWLLLAVPVFFIVLIGAILFLLGYAVLKTITPDQTKKQKKLVKDFVDKIQRLSEITQTPKIILLFRTVRDAISPKRKDALIESVIADATSLSADYRGVVTSFSKSS